MKGADIGVKKYFKHTLVFKPSVNFCPLVNSSPEWRLSFFTFLSLWGLYIDYKLL